MAPQSAAVRRADGTFETVPVDDVHVGDIVKVTTGDRIPVDGTVISGTGLVNESAITGEPIPVDKAVGSSASAGTLLDDGMLTIRADMVGEDTTFGKIIGAGMPVGAYGGRREIMEMVSPVGAVYQAGTLSGNPVAMAAGLAQIGYLNEHRELYQQLNETGDWFYGEIENTVREAGLPYQVNHIGSLGSLFFTGEPVTDYESAKTSDTKAYAAYCNFMMDHGVYIAPAQFEAMFLSMMHTREELTQTLSVMREYFLG